MMTKKRPSLRLRLALQTMLVTGVVVVAFGIGSWWFARKQLARNHDLLVAQKARLLWPQLTPRYREIHFQNATREVFDEEEQAVAVTIIWHSEDHPIANVTQLKIDDDIRESFLKILPSGSDVITRAIESERPQRQARARSSEVGALGSRRRPVMPEIRAPEYFTVKQEGNEWRFGAFSNPHYTLFVGLSTENLIAEARQSALGFGIAGVAALLLSGLGGWWISGRAIRPLKRIVTTANQMSAGRLDERIRLDDGDHQEIDQLVHALNNMTERLQKSFAQSTRFTADASHELKTPLAVIQSELHDALRSQEIDDETRRKIDLVLHQISRLKRMTASLLLLSQTDAGELPVKQTRYDLVHDLAGLLEDAQSLCETTALAYHQEIDAEIFVTADRDLMHQVFQNLVSNAVKHNRPDGTVRIELKTIETGAVFQISNTTVELDPKATESLFDRFYRAESSRHRDGFGLGLNIARELAKANGAELRLIQGAPQTITFQVQLTA